MLLRRAKGVRSPKGRNSQDRKGAKGEVAWFGRGFQPFGPGLASLVSLESSRSLDYHVEVFSSVKDG